MGNLQPLSGNKPVPALDLARELRTLLEGLGISQNRYAARVHLDRSAVSRYLSGERIPPWGFVYDLLVESTKHNGGAPPTKVVVGHLKRLHKTALETGGSPTHRVQLLQDELAEADQRAVRALERENRLEGELRDVQHQLAQVTLRALEIESAQDDDSDTHATELALYQRELGELHHRHVELTTKCDQLEAELRKAHKRLDLAEKRCRELEQQLDMITATEESPTVSAGDSEARNAVDISRLDDAAPLPSSDVTDLERTYLELEIRRQTAITSLAALQARREAVEASAAQAAAELMVAQQQAAEIEAELGRLASQVNRDTSQ